MKEKKAAAKEFEDKKIELKENLIAELEEKKKMIENEKLTMELTGGKEDEYLSLVLSTLLLLRKKSCKDGSAGLHRQLVGDANRGRAQIDGLLMEKAAQNSVNC